MNVVQCTNHSFPVEQICMGKGCNNRLMCASCIKEQQHKFHGRHIKFNLRETILQQKARYEERCVERLNQMVDYLNKKFFAQIAALRKSIEDEIIVRGRSEFAGANVSPQVLSWMMQVEQNSYTGLNEKHLDALCEVLQTSEANVKIQHINQTETKKLDVIVEEAFKDIKLTERVYWAGMSRAVKQAEETGWAKGFFKSLILEHQPQSMDRYRKENDQLERSIDEISKAVECKGGQKKLKLKKGREMLSEIIRSDKIEWKTLTELSFSSFGIVFLDPLIYLRTENLRTLDLSFNEIHSAEPLLMVELQSLRKLNLDNNRITCLEPFCRAHWPLLQMLDISNNMLTSIEHAENFNFPYLNYLYLSGNKLKSIRQLEKVVWPRIITIQIKNTALPPSEIPDALHFTDQTLGGKFWGVF